MSTPIERAAGPLVAAYEEALRDPRIPHVGQHAALATLIAALDVDELAAMLARLRFQEDMPYVIARAVVAHLTKGDENDE